MKRAQLWTVKSPKKSVANLEHLEGALYHIQYFQDAAARLSYRPVDGPYMARFTPFTTLQRIPVISELFPLYAYSSVPFDRLQDRADNKELLTDIIAMVSSIDPIRLASVKGIPTPVRDIMVTDGSHTLKMVLWGHHAIHFDQQTLIEQSHNATMVVLFVGLTVATRNDEMYLQSSSHTAWYANAPLPDIVALQDRFAGQITQITSKPQPASATEIITTTVSYLADLNPHETLGNIYGVRIAIKGLTAERRWWYDSCGRCKKMLQHRDNSLQCPSCGVVTSTPRYQITFDVTDPSEVDKPTAKQAQIKFFGNLAEQLIGRPLHILLSAAHQTENTVPPEIKNFFGKQFDITTKITERTFHQDTLSFVADSFSPAILEPATATPSQHNSADSQTKASHTVVDINEPLLTASPPPEPSNVPDKEKGKRPATDTPPATATTAKRKLFQTPKDT